MLDFRDSKFFCVSGGRSKRYSVAKHKLAHHLFTSLGWHRSISRDLMRRQFRSFITESSIWHAPRVLVTLRVEAFSDSIALVV